MGSLYCGVGAVVGVALLVWGIVWPLAYMCRLWSKNFVNDVALDPDGTPAEQTKKLFCGRLFKDLHDRFIFLTFSACAAIALWPLILLLFIGYGALHFLRLAARLQRHSTDKSVHVAKAEDK